MTDFGHWEDRSVIEACSWRLAAELSRRHPGTTRLFRTHPGDGMYDVLTLRPAHGGPGDLSLNRNGSIRVLERFDGRGGDDKSWSWVEYLQADPRRFVHTLEDAAGLPRPSTVPAATQRTLTLRVLAQMVASSVKTLDHMEIASGFLDTSGYGGGPVNDLQQFAIDPDLMRPRDDDPYGQAGYRFWLLRRRDEPIVCFEQTAGLVWTRTSHQPTQLMALYEESRRHLMVTALKVLRLVDQV